MSPLAGLTSAFNYVGLIEKAIKKLKYHFVSDLAKDLTELFLTFIGEHKAFTQFCQQMPILAPIPLHQKRLNWRGFNQSELLGQRIAQNLGLPFVPDLLVRTKETLPQADLDKEARLKNVAGAFEFNRASRFAIHDSRVIIFDDVWTSGATLREAAKVLKRAGAEKVCGLTLAR
jgi:ComF family protein